MKRFVGWETTEINKRNLLIVGCGYVGKELVCQAQRDHKIWALTRRVAAGEHKDSRSAELQSLGVHPIQVDWVQEASFELPSFDRVLVAVPHRAVEPHAQQTHVVGLQNLFTCLKGKPRIIYLSTTGVYGDCPEEMVDEQTPVAPTRIGPEIAVEAEKWLRSQQSKHIKGSDSPNKVSIETQVHAITVRLAGIYGPGRIPLAAKLRTGEPLAVPQHGFLNLVHVSDIARMILQVFDHFESLQRSCYVFSDGSPIERLKFYSHLAKLCGVEHPQFVEPDPDNSRARRATSKKVSPARLVSELGFEYHFPSYESGLAQALGE
ncbi:MAG: NAD-dependent epimerase/dehydratase family protein [Planctomycetota bacterium]